MARSARADLEAALGGGVALARETVTPFLGAGHYLAQGRDRADASDSMDWARDQTRQIKYDPSPEGQQAQREMMSTAGDVASNIFRATGAERLAKSRYGQGVIQAAGDWWGGLSEDVKAGAEMIGAGLDLGSNVIGAGAIPFLFKRMAKTGGDELADALQTAADSRKPLTDYEKPVEFKQADTIDYTVPGRNKKGVYVGAPRNVGASPQKLGGMRNELTRLLEKGAPGRLWYDESTEAAEQLTGGANRRKHLYAGSTAITSRGASVPSNQGFGIKGYNQTQAGQPANAGRFPNVQGEAIDQLASGKPYEGGPKETPFYEGLTIDERAKGIRPTNDLWMARAFDYTTPEGELWAEGLGVAQHRFMDKEINRLVDKANEAKIGGVDDWTPERVQAAIWVAKKAELEGTDVGKASANFSDAMRRHTGTIRYQATPSTSIDHLKGFSGTEEYQDLVDTMLQDPQGRDRSALNMGLLTRPSERAFGEYMGNVSPSSGMRVLAGTTTGGSLVDPASEALMDITGAGRGLLLGQDTVGTTFIKRSAGDQRDTQMWDPLPKPKRGELMPGATPQFGPGANKVRKQGKTIENIAYIDLGSAPGPAEIKDINARLKTQFGDGVFAVHSENGIQIVNDAGVDTGNFKKGVKSVFKGAKPEFGFNSGKLLGNTNWDDPGFKPSAWLSDIEEASANLGPDAMKRFEDDLVDNARVMNEVDAALEAHVPDVGPRSELLTLTREIISSKGMKGLKEAVEKGILPAVILGVVGSQFLQQPGPGAEQS